MNKYFLALCLLVAVTGCGQKHAEQPIRFLVYTDLHADLAPGGGERLDTILRAAADANVDFIIDLGDFAFAQPGNKQLVDKITADGRDHYHVLGNHDMDRSDKKTYCDFVGANAPFYYFDKGVFRFIVLDTNHFVDADGNVVDYANGNYYGPGLRREYITDQQLEWMEGLLADDERICVIFSHGPINEKFSEPGENRRVHDVIRGAVDKGARVAMVAGGHNHSDNFHRFDDIPYWQVNSATYLWGGEGFSDPAIYDPEQLQRYPNLPSMAIYAKTLYAIVEIDPAGEVTITGVEGDYAYTQPDPARLAIKPYPTSASIVNRNYRFLP